jgi:hypothetical protein
MCDNSNVVAMDKQYLIQAIDENCKFVPIVEVPRQGTEDLCYQKDMTPGE